MRNISLDIFRGLIIFLMIIVNSQGAGSDPYPILDHAEWFGFTLADFVFPSFLFIMGCSLAYSKASNLSWDDYLAKVTKRTIILFVIGLFLNWFPFFLFNKQGLFEWKYFENLRFMGVFQRLALCYFLAAIIVKAIPKHSIIVGMVMLLGYWAAMMVLVPLGAPFTRDGNLGTVIDNFMIPKSHLYRGDNGFEPEGLLGTIPASVNMIAGFICARYIRNNGFTIETLRRFLFVGFGLLILTSLWSVQYPVSKKLWTSSYVVLTIGLDLFLLATLAYIYEVKKIKFAAKFFQIFGRNPLAIYVFSLLFLKIILVWRVEPTISLHKFLGEQVFQKILMGPGGSLLFALCFTLICFLFALWLDRKKIIIKI